MKACGPQRDPLPLRIPLHQPQERTEARESKRAICLPGGHTVQGTGPAGLPAWNLHAPPSLSTLPPLFTLSDHIGNKTSSENSPALLLRHVPLSAMLMVLTTVLTLYVVQLYFDQGPSPYLHTVSSWRGGPVNVFVCCSILNTRHLDWPIKENQLCAADGHKGTGQKGKARFPNHVQEAEMQPDLQVRSLASLVSSAESCSPGWLFASFQLYSLTYLFWLVEHVSVFMGNATHQLNRML